MLVEFKVRNFRSLRDEQRLSFVAGGDALLAKTHCMETGVKGLPTLVRSNVVYGANATGKSTLIFALATMRNLVVASTGMPEAVFADQYTPFKLDRASLKESTEFEITVLLDGVRYQYGFTYDAQRIRDEWLVVYKSGGGKGQGWFDRRWSDTSDDYEWAPFSAYFTGQKDVWRKATRPQALFLTTAAQLNSEQLKPLFDWITNKVVILSWMGAVSLLPTLRLLVNILRAADIHVSDIRVDKQAGHQIEFKIEAGKPPELASHEREVPIVRFLHSVEGEEPVWFDHHFESAGTQKLLAYIGPLLDAIDSGKLLVVDELDSSLHPIMMRFILGLIHDPQISTHSAQLLITTHDTSLLDTELLRRDQIWFVEKNERQASHLYPLSDFSPRKNEALERGYLRGRYGGVPFMSRLNVH
jgi:hypothetical protein